MKSLFYFGILFLIIFEILKAYLVIPLPGSQDLDSLQLAYFLHDYRWLLRTLFILMIAVGMIRKFSKHKWIPVTLAVLAAIVVYFTNVKMTAESMFHIPNHLAFANEKENKIPDDALVIAVENNGEAKAYPIRFLAFHHQVQDSIGGKSLLVTYCDVCRSGYVFDPFVNGKHEVFRLVGMNHFNAMIEDQTTKSWWRQATGEAVAGELKGKKLADFPSQQMSLAQFFSLFPNGKVMLPDADFISRYDSTGSFEKGKDTDPLTRTDSLSWKEKSWVIGLSLDKHEKAYDWNALKKSGIINDTIGKTPVVLVLFDEGKSFAAYVRPDETDFSLRNDSLISGTKSFSVNKNELKKIQANQVFWHTWKTFHPATTKQE